MIPVRPYYRLLSSYLRPQRARVILLTFVLFASIGLQLFNPQLIKRFIDGATGGAPAEELIPIAVAFMLVAVVHQGLSIWSTYLAEDVGWSATNKLRLDLTDHVLHLDMGFHKAHAPGELIERIDGDITSLSNFFSAMTIKVVENGLLIAGILVLLWLESWIIGLFATLFVTSAMLGMARFHRVAVPRWKAVRATSARFYGFVGEQIEGTEDIRANGATGFMVQRFAAIQRTWLPQMVRAWLGWAVLWSTSVLVFAFSMTIVFILGSWQFAAGVVTLGSV
jgi:ATP-binding cassette subfamily B protein